MADTISTLRANVLIDAFNAHPDRFVAGKPSPPHVPDAAWINKPKSIESLAQNDNLDKPLKKTH